MMLKMFPQDSLVAQQKRVRPVVWRSGQESKIGRALRVGGA